DVGVAAPAGRAGQFEGAGVGDDHVVRDVLDDRRPPAGGLVQPFGRGVVPEPVLVVAAAAHPGVRRQLRGPLGDGGVEAVERPHLRVPQVDGGQLLAGAGGVVVGIV